MKPRIVERHVYHVDGGDYGAVGYVKRRDDEKLERNGGERFAAWAVRIVDGLESGPPHDMCFFKRLTEATKHAKAAARRVA